MVQPDPEGGNGLAAASVKPRTDSDDFKALTVAQRELVAGVYGGGEDTLVNEGTPWFDSRGEIVVAEGKAYRAVRLDQMIDFLQAAGRAFTITQRTADPFALLWPLFIDELEKQAAL